MNGNTFFVVFSVWFIFAIFNIFCARIIGDFSWDEALIVTGKLTLVLIMTAIIIIGMYKITH